MRFLSLRFVLVAGTSSSGACRGGICFFADDGAFRFPSVVLFVESLLLCRFPRVSSPEAFVCLWRLDLPRCFRARLSSEERDWLRAGEGDVDERSALSELDESSESRSCLL